MDRDLSVLCYVRLPWLYFTTRPLNEQTGDDWNDAPYEHNAGPPYERSPDGSRIYRMAIATDLEEPCTWHTNSPWSVDDINRKVVPWLQGPRYGNRQGNDPIWAGETYAEVRAKVLRMGGRVFEECDG
jgi:hypothetical protein